MKRAGIRAQLTLVVAGVGLFLLAVHVWVDVLAEQRRLHTSTRREARALTDRLSDDLETLLRRDLPVESVMRPLPAPMSSLSALALVDDRGVVVSASNRAWRGLPLKRTALGRDSTVRASAGRHGALDVAQLAGHRLVGAADVRGRSATYRLLTVFDNREAYADASRDSLVEGLWTALFSAFVLNVLWLMLDSRVTRPALAIARAADRLRAGDLSARSGVRGGDEIRRAGEAFDRMAERVETSEQSLVRTRALLDAVLRAMPLSVVAVSRTDRSVLFANPSAEHMTGRRFAAGEALSENLDRVMFEYLDGRPCPPDERPIPTVLRTGRPAEFEDLVFVREDGRRIPVYIAAAPVATLPGEPFDVVVAVTQDRRELQRRIDELRERDQRFEAVAKATGQIVYEWTLTTGQSRRSESLTTVLGFKPEEFGPGLEDWDRRLHPDDRARVRAELEICQREGRMFDCEYRMRHANGSWRVIRDRGHFTFEPDGRVATLIGAMADVTEQRELERKLTEAERMQSVGTLAGGVAHDFNNQLTAVLGHLDLLAGGMPKKSALQEHVRLAQLGAERCAELTRGLLAFSRQLTTHPETIAINPLVETTRESMRQALPASIAMETSLEAGLWPALADPGQIRQVLVNLCMNARDAMPEGGQLVLETRNRRVDEAGVRSHAQARAGDYVEIAVRDSGLGIAPDVLPHVFEPFFTTKPVGAGTGLGLSLAYGIASSHGGWIDVESRLGEGSTFRILLPRASDDARAATSAAAAARDASAAGPRTLLIADDEEMVRGLTARALESAGYRVLAASNGDEAVALHRQHRGEIDGVLLDVTMPGRSGVEIMDEIRGIDPEARVVLTSGFSAATLEGPLAARAQTATAFLAKPYTAATLVELMRRVVGPPGPAS
ncbi:MAG TPA: ATP-binding protein [Candidatus Saccharimonadaceae bacterium]|jgi:signal transduction histidine kinase/ActR/RegA family two-component response regulator/HAMP domain-containing protein|nr:ATP-binding protein [Candidatus Saccharimonadaceae bacterium]